MPAVASWIKHAAAAKEIVEATLPAESDERTRLHALVYENVLCQIRNLQTHPVVAAKLAAGRSGFTAGSIASRPARLKHTTPARAASCR